WRKHRFGSPAGETRKRGAWFWSACADDGASRQQAHLDRGGGGRPAARGHGVGGVGANDARKPSSPPSCPRVPGAARRLDQTARVRWRWALSVCETFGPWTIYLAESGERNGFVDGGAV